MDEPTNGRVDLARLKPHPDNNKIHPARQIEAIRSSLRKFGQPRSIVAQAPQQADGYYLIVAGHGVTQAALAEGWTSLRADILPADWPPERIKAYLIADNRIAELSENDDAQTLALLDEIKAYDPELVGAAGFSSDDLDELIRSVSPDLREAPDEWREYDETIADDVEMITCPHCGVEFPK